MMKSERIGGRIEISRMRAPTCVDFIKLLGLTKARCASRQPASCSENSAIRPEVSGLGQQPKRGTGRFACPTREAFTLSQKYCRTSPRSLVLGIMRREFITLLGGAVRTSGLV